MSTQLANGRIVEEFKMTNGATYVDMADGGDMSEAEWEEYCAILRALSLQQSRARLAGRKVMPTEKQIPSDTGIMLLQMAMLDNIQAARDVARKLKEYGWSGSAQTILGLCETAREADQLISYLAKLPKSISKHIAAHTFVNNGRGECAVCGDSFLDTRHHGPIV